MKVFILTERLTDGYGQVVYNIVNSVCADFDTALDRKKACIEAAKQDWNDATVEHEEQSPEWYVARSRVFSNTPASYVLSLVISEHYVQS